MICPICEQKMLDYDYVRLFISVMSYKFWLLREDEKRKYLFCPSCGFHLQNTFKNRLLNELNRRINNLGKIIILSRYLHRLGRYQ